MNKLLPLFLCIINFWIIEGHPADKDFYTSHNKFQEIDRKLTESEVKERGIGILVTEVINQIEEIDLKKMARSSIFETSYGFRWKMYNVQTSKVVIIKVDKDFQIISIRDSKNT